MIGETTCGTDIDFTIFLCPSFVVQGLRGREGGSCPLFHHPLQQLPGQSAELRIDQYDLLQEHPSVRRPARFVFFSSLQASVGT